MTETLKKQRASGRAEIKYHEIKPYDQQAEGPTLSNMELIENFHGDIEAENRARSLLCANPDGSSSLVSISRVIGKVGDKSGSFVLQGSVILNKKHAEGRWSVVPNSGTQELSGIRGEGGFTTELGRPAEIWLDYWFE